MTHSPEPWVAVQEDDHYDIDHDGNGSVIGCEGLFEEDAKRIVTCVNFLAGFPTEMLQALMDVREAYDHARTNLWTRIGDAQYLANRERRGIE